MKTEKVIEQMQSFSEGNLQNAAVALALSHLEKTAKLNKDDWVTKFTPYADNGTVEWEVEVIETTDRHILIQAFGETPADALVTALRDLDGALANWGYKSLKK